eukprot:scaffold3195_cov100-Isochrysis_galbana.AAC.4
MRRASAHLHHVFDAIPRANLKLAHALVCPCRLIRAASDGDHSPRPPTVRLELVQNLGHRAQHPHGLPATIDEVAPLAQAEWRAPAPEHVPAKACSGRAVASRRTPALARGRAPRETGESGASALTAHQHAAASAAGKPNAHVGLPQAPVEIKHHCSRESTIRRRHHARRRPQSCPNRRRRRAGSNQGPSHRPTSPRPDN